MSGTVTIADDETVSGSGRARELYDEIVSVETAANPLPVLSPPPKDWTGTAQSWAAKIAPVRLLILRSWAREANAAADAMTKRAITHLDTSSSYTVGAADDMITVSGTDIGAAVSILLPLASSRAGRRLTVKNIVTGSYATTINRSGSDTIDGATSLVLSSDYDKTTLVSDGSSRWLTE